MKRRPATAAAIIMLALATSILAQEASKSAATILHAKGAFDVKLTPMPADDYADGKALGRVDRPA